MTVPSQKVRSDVSITLAAFGLAILLGSACFLATGPSLDLFIAGIASIGLFLPLVVLLARDFRRQVLVTGAMIDGIAIVWLIAVFTSITVLQWLLCYIVLIAFALAVAGLALVLKKITRSVLAASAITVIVNFAWLAWPIWLAPHLSGARGAAIASWLVWLHPIFAMNGALSDLGTWTHQPFMYHLTNLGQDIPYTLPASVWPCAIAHVSLGALASLFVALAARSSWRF
jgi:hypothetical protein